MAGAALNAKTVDATKAKGGRRLTLNDDLVPGLHLRVHASGKKTWTHRFRLWCRQRRREVGTYPAMSLADARDEVRRRTLVLARGEDPDAQREAAKEGDRSFRALAEMVLEVKAADTRPRTQAIRRDLADHYLFPAWGARPANRIMRADVIDLVEEIRDVGKGVTANRVRALAHLVFEEGLYREFGGAGFLLGNPVHGTRRPLANEPTRNRYLLRDELGSVWTVLGAQNPLTAAIGKLALLTGQRVGQVLRMRWDKIEDDAWETPPEDHKGGRLVMTPLSSEALAVLDGLRETATSKVWVFPARDGAKHPHIHNVSSATLQRIRDAAGIPPWTWHDFRRTLRVWLTSAPSHHRTPGLGIRPDVVDFGILTHKGKGEGSALGLEVYTPESEQPWALFPEKKAALEAWGAFVRAAVEEHERKAAEAERVA